MVCSFYFHLVESNDGESVASDTDILDHEFPSGPRIIVSADYDFATNLLEYVQKFIGLKINEFCRFELLQGLKVSLGTIEFIVEKENIERVLKGVNETVPESVKLYCLELSIRNILFVSDMYWLTLNFGYKEWLAAIEKVSREHNWDSIIFSIFKSTGNFINTESSERNLDSYYNRINIYTNKRLFDEIYHLVDVDVEDEDEDEKYKEFMWVQKAINHEVCNRINRGIVADALNKLKYILENFSNFDFDFDEFIQSDGFKVVFRMFHIRNVCRSLKIGESNNKKFFLTLKNIKQMEKKCDAMFCSKKTKLKLEEDISKLKLELSNFKSTFSFSEQRDDVATSSQTESVSQIEQTIKQEGVED